MPVILGLISNNQDSQLHRIVEVFQSAWMKWHACHGCSTVHRLSGGSRVRLHEHQTPRTLRVRATRCHVPANFLQIPNQQGCLQCTDFRGIQEWGPYSRQSLEVKGAAMLGICKKFAGTWRLGAQGPLMYVALGWGTLCSWRHGLPDPDMFLEVCPANLWTVGCRE